MIARSFRPGLWATLFTAPAILALLALGTWQVERLHWKEALIQRLHDRLNAPAVPLPVDIPDPEAFDLRPVTLTGRFLRASTMLVLGHPRSGQAGYELVTPFQRAEGGPPVLVKHGWVPMDKRAKSLAGQGTEPEMGVETIDGVARLPTAPGWMQLKNQPGAEIWNRIDPAAMAARLGLPLVAPLVIEAPSQTPADLPNNHRLYAITWYSLAAVLLIIYVLSHLHRRPTHSAGQKAF